MNSNMTIHKLLDDQICVKFQYKGYEISLTTMQPAEIAVFKNNSSAVVQFYGTTIDDLKDAIAWVDKQ